MHQIQLNLIHVYCACTQPSHQASWDILLSNDLFQHTHSTLSSSWVSTVDCVPSLHCFRVSSFYFFLWPKLLLPPRFAAKDALSPSPTPLGLTFNADSLLGSQAWKDLSVCSAMGTLSPFPCNQQWIIITWWQTYLFTVSPRSVSFFTFAKLVLQ
jgi:hypothetical protein